jgi:hypothetical protein
MSPMWQPQVKITVPMVMLVNLPKANSTLKTMISNCPLEGSSYSN